MSRSRASVSPISIRRARSSSSAAVSRRDAAQRREESIEALDLVG